MGLKTTSASVSLGCEDGALPGEMRPKDENQAAAQKRGPGRGRKLNTSPNRETNTKPLVKTEDGAPAMEVWHGITSASGHVCLPRGGYNQRGHADLRLEPKLLREENRAERKPYQGEPR